MSNTEMKRLKGVKVIVHMSFGSSAGYVAFADRTKGITILAEDSDQPICCINRQEILDVFRLHKTANRLYHEAFSAQVCMIEEGHSYNMRFCGNKGCIERRAESGEGLNCAFA